MAKRILSYDPVSGDRVVFDYEQSTDRMVITHEQNIEPILDYAHELCVDQERTRLGMAHDMWHYAHVPAITIMEMKHKYGVEFFNRDHSKKVFELLNTEYKKCKTTHKTHNVRHS